MISLCSDWEFTREWSAGFAHGEGRFPLVDLPHTAGEVPLHYAKPEDYAGICGYRRGLSVPLEYRGKRLFLQFDGAAHFAEVYLNGEKLAEHACGYTAFRVEITSAVRYGMENRLAVRLDTTENPAVPPFGFVLDYLAYGGLYREVWLDVRGADVIEDVFVTTPTLTRAEIALTVSGSGARRRVTLLDAAGAVCAMTEGDDNKYYVNYSNARLWTLDEPNLYSIRAELLDASGAVTDEKTVRFGFRTAEFRRGGFYLNGERVFLRGLNRHQCYPYMGYAAPEALQREDARILKEELCCTAVRTSHYPQSRHFIDACDELGLLVFTELPGWQHIGDAAWKRRSVENVREMVTQYRNHPSIVLWGVRINESLDDDDFYRETNALAHSLDPSRQTSGVRYLEKSHLLEDVYAYNDFSHDGTAPGAKKRSAVTPEYVGINLRHARIADNLGNQPQDEPVVPGGPTAYFATVPVRAMTAAIEAQGIPAAVSYTAGTYVCNDLLYTLLHHYAETPVRAGFIHVPFLPEQAPQGVASMPLAQMIRALEAAVYAL